MIDLLKSERGMALPAVFAVMLTVIGFATAMLTLSNTEYRIANNDYKAQKALYLADAGINYAIHMIDKNTFNQVPHTLALSPEETISINSITKQGEKWLVNATGKFQNISKVISSLVEVKKKPNELDKAKDIQIGILPGGTIVFENQNNGTIAGNVYYSTTPPGFVRFQDASYGVYQNTNVVNYIDLYGQIINDMEKISAPDINDKINTKFSSGLGGMYHVDATNPTQNNTLTLSTPIKYKGKSILYVKGNLNITTSIEPDTVSTDNFLFIIVTGRINIHQNSQENVKAVLCSDTIDFQNGQAEVQGVIIANKMTIPNANKNFYRYEGTVIQNIDLSTLATNKEYLTSNWRIVQ